MSHPRPAAPAVDHELAEALATRLRRALVDVVTHLGGEDVADRPALVVPRSPVPLAPALLAQAHPKGPARTQAKALYERCLAHYRTGVRPQDEAGGVDDVGAAAAAFVAANLGAVHGGTPSEASLLRLERQLAGVVQLTADWDRAPARERQAYFEKLAILAVLVHEMAREAPLQGPAAVANVQRAARGYIHTLLGLSADELTLGPDGLAAREAR